MDDYFFENHVRSCKEISENSSFLEIYNFSNGEVYYDKGALPMSEFQNFLERKGVFEPPKKKDGASIVSGMRLILQLGAQHPETFTANYISYTHNEYIAMVRKLSLPFRAIEGTSIVGPFFWAALDQDDANPHLQIIFRKSDVRKKGLTRGWELMLSHNFRSAITTGYAKGTESSQLEKIVDQHLRACARHIAHPLIFPTILLGHDLDSTMDDKQRKARHWLRRLEHAITDRNEIDASERYSNFDLDEMNRELVECHSQVLWKRPQAYVDTLDEIEKAMTKFRDARERLLRDGQLFAHLGDPATEVALDKLHRSMLSRFDFFRQKLKGIRHYAHTTISRLDIQRGALYNIIAQKESKLNLEMAQHQRLLALASKRDNQSMKALSIVGAVFLPATYLASLFSMTFFNFQVGGNGGGGSGGGDDDSPSVAPTLWIYFAITIPLTLVVLAALFWWDRTREKKFAAEEAEVSTTLPDLERRVVTSLREKRTGLNSMDTKRWDSI
ncbi:hypothetical protein HMPREF1624_06551 [Sporothrix schenckii ATCC 58251]|uniref:Uncharacterized protein n=1 Tax=Sporothrix schenckii (strain ATCC 58251 / de Perez 2211183) TaxID=1391915 RepID=U7PRW9_SPOS1|nr:hypothetical protein HMPREF1624_06551 [Sporothrix schenckii ATCC 58251]